MELNNQTSQKSDKFSFIEAFWLVVACTLGALLAIYIIKYGSMLALGWLH